MTFWISLALATTNFCLILVHRQSIFSRAIVEAQVIEQENLARRNLDSLYWYHVIVTCQPNFIDHNNKLLMDRLISCHRYPAATHSIADSSIKYKKRPACIPRRLWMKLTAMPMLFKVTADWAINGEKKKKKETKLAQHGTQVGHQKAVGDSNLSSGSFKERNN